jgi:type IV secretory pathway VirB10-like protein
LSEGGVIGLTETEEEKIISQSVIVTDELPEIPQPIEEGVPEKDDSGETKDQIPSTETEKPADAQAVPEQAPGAVAGPEHPAEEPGRRPERPRDDRRYDSRGGGRRDRDRPLTNEDKLRMYKKQSEERLLDIKRGKEAKVGKKRK